MRPYSNLSETERLTLNVDLCWDPDKIAALPLPSPLLWVQTMKEKNGSGEMSLKKVTLLDIKENCLCTDFGLYDLSTGKNIRSFDGTRLRCGCCGQLYLPKGSHALPR